MADRPTRRVGRCARRAFRACAFFTLGLAAGCASSRVDPILARGVEVDGSTPGMIASVYDGPPLVVEDAEGGQRLVFELPSAGWSISLDETRAGAIRSEVRITIRRPNPQFLYPQAIVTQRVATGLNTRTPVLVGVRVLGFAQDTDDVPYTAAFVTSADQQPAE